MHDTPRHPTPYPDVNLFLCELHAGIIAVLGGDLRALYVEGSLALGDFDRTTSDIDVVAVTAAEVRGKRLDSLRELHAGLADSWPRWASELESSYIPDAALRRHDPTNAVHPRIERGHGEQLVVQRHDIDWVIHRHIIREHGIVLAGPPPRELVGPISPDELRQATAELVRIWWEPMTANPARLGSPGYRAYAVLTMCRVLYTLAHGTVVSKPTAARWARAGVAQPWADLINCALNGSMAVNDSLTATLALISFTARQSRDQ